MSKKEKERKKYSHLLKVTCFTPSGKSEKCEHEWRKQFPTFKTPVESKIVNDHEFYWVYGFDKDKDMYNFQKKVMLAETSIRKLYRFMIKFFTRANKLMNKSAWTVKKVKKWLMKMWKKNIAGDEDAVKKMDAMSDEQFKEYIKLEDKDDMELFLEGEIITTKYLGPEV